MNRRTDKTDRQTDRQTDGRTDRVIPIYPLPQTLFGVGGYNKYGSFMFKYINLRIRINFCTYGPPVPVHLKNYFLIYIMQPHIDNHVHWSIKSCFGDN